MAAYRDERRPHLQAGGLFDFLDRLTHGFRDPSQPYDLAVLDGIPRLGLPDRKHFEFQVPSVPAGGSGTRASTVRT